MIFNLSRLLPEHFAAVNLLRYISFRSACACLWFRTRLSCCASLWLNDWLGVIF